MTKKFIAFKPVSGVFKETLTPYQRMIEKGEMSPLLEVDGNYYRILRTTINGLEPKKIIVCRDDGEMEENEEITLKCFQFYLHLTYYSLAKKNMVFQTTQGGKRRHEPLIQAFQTMVTDLTPVLSTDEQESMEFHLHYLEEIYRVSEVLSDLGKELLAYWKQLEKDKVDKLSAAQMSEIINMVVKRRLFINQFEGVFYEDGHRARTTVQAVFKKRKYIRQLSNRHYVQRVLKEMQGATKASKRFIKDAKMDYEEIEKHLAIDKGLFSIEKLIEETYNGRLREQMDQVNMKHFMETNWIRSSDSMG